MASTSVCILRAILTLVSAVTISGVQAANIDISLSTIEMIQKSGYPAEMHSVTTQDGYILGLHRIPYSPKSPASANKSVVFLQHGLASSSADWVMMGPEKGFGYILADLGFDVWLGNSRGNRYSRKHRTLNPQPTNKAFWNFSWHELGMYDIPAVIDYILAETGQPKLFYVGHSQGTTQFYVMASERPEYNDKIRAMFSFAPVAYMSNVENPVIQLVRALRLTSKQGEQWFGVRGFVPPTSMIQKLAKSCMDGQPGQTFCETFIFLICGFDHEQLNKTMIPVIIANTPAGASTKQNFHYLQQIISAKFRQYDYGRRGNLQRYATETPPAYNTSKITAPVALHYSTNDWLSSAADVDILYNELVNPIGKFLVPYQKFNHLDYLWAIDVKKLLYDQVIDIMAKY